MPDEPAARVDAGGTDAGGTDAGGADAGTDAGEAATPAGTKRPPRPGMGRGRMMGMRDDGPLLFDDRF